MDDLERLRLRRAGLVDIQSKLATSGPAAFVGKVTTEVPLVGQFFLVNPVEITGDETEGSDGTETVDASRTIAVFLVGPVAPEPNDLIVCRRVDHRWVADRMSPAGVPTWDCNGCAVPETVVLTWTFLNVPDTGGGSGTLTIPLFNEGGTATGWSSDYFQHAGDMDYLGNTNTVGYWVRVTVVCSSPKYRMDVVIRATKPFPVPCFSGQVPNCIGALGIRLLTIDSCPPLVLHGHIFTGAGGAFQDWVVTEP